MRTTLAVVMLVVLASACSRGAEENPGGKAPSAPSAPAAPAAPSAPSAPRAPNAPPPGGSLAEPNGPIDSKSAEAAGQVVQSYGALIERGRWKEANALWSSAAAAERFAKSLAGYAEIHLEIGTPGDLEGAAGSIFVTMPVFFYGDGKDKQPMRQAADVTLRRVNDVPGSTEAQRRWHIERIDLGS